MGTADLTISAEAIPWTRFHRQKLRDTLVVGLLSSLPAFTAIKIAGLQLEDLILLALLGVVSANFLCGGFKFRISRDIRSLAISYALLLAGLLCFALLAFRLKTYPLEDVSLLKSPFLFSASRYVQFAAVVCGFLWMTDVFLRKPDLLKLALYLYWWIGVWICLFAVFSWVSLRIGGVYVRGAYDSGDAIRARGFFNEGGPFGLYAVSVMIVGLLRRYLTGKRVGFINTGICAAAFFLSRSHAAFFLAAMLLLCSVFTAASFGKRVLSLSLVGGFLIIAAVAMDLPNVLAGYLASYQNIEDRVATMGQIDSNLVMGRVAAAYIVPRMVEAHPITGIGIGNYSLMRNDPRYLGSLPTVTWLEDLPGLGLLGDTAEFGIPLLLLTAFLLLVPYFVCERRASILGTAALFQIFAHLMGAHLNFLYPWFISACAIAAGKYQGERPKVRRPVLTLVRFIAGQQSCAVVNHPVQGAA